MLRIGDEDAAIVLRFTFYVLRFPSLAAHSTAKTRMRLNRCFWRDERNGGRLCRTHHRWGLTDASPHHAPRLPDPGHAIRRALADRRRQPAPPGRGPTDNRRPPAWSRARQP